MFRNYFKIGYRNILRNKLSSFINAVGLALAVGCCLVVFRFVHFLYVSDTFHENRDAIFVVERLVDENGDPTLWGPIPEPLGPAMQEEFPQIRNQARIDHAGAIFRYKDQVFNEWITFVDDPFYEIFDFPVKWGREADFIRHDAIVLSKTAAEKYFGAVNPVGEEIHLRFNVDGAERDELFIVQGVMEEFPEDASFRFNMLIPYERQRGLFVDDFSDWTRHTNTLFLQLNAPEEIAFLAGKESKYLEQYNLANEGWETGSLHYEPLTSIVRHSYKVTDSNFMSAHIAALFMLLIIGGALLCLACFNYMNIAVASANTRLKEIGVRKVMGGRRSQLIIQFLSENLLICLLAVSLGLVLAQTLFLPWFNSMSGLDFTFDYRNDPKLWIFLLLMVIITAVGGAGYPAFYLSSFQPVTVLKNKLQFGSKNRFRKVLLGAQFLLSFLAIFSAIAFLAVTEDVHDKPWGYTPEGIINVRLGKGGDFANFRNEVTKNPKVAGVTGSVQQIGVWSEQADVRVEGKDYHVENLSVGYDFVETLELELLNGRPFDQHKPTDLTQSVIVNEQFRRQMGWPDAVGRKIELDSSSFLVIGEVKDFHQNTFETKIPLMTLRLAEEGEFSQLIVRAAPADLPALTKEIEAAWKRLYPDIPFDYYYQDAVFDDYFNAFTQVGSVFSATAFLTIIISVIGLFGLAMLTLHRRMKELSIRKILGASFFDITYQLHREFLVTIGIATLLGIPLGYLMISAMVGILFPEASLGVIPFIIALCCLLVMTVLSIAKHVYAVVVSNPANHLRDE